MDSLAIKKKFSWNVITTLVIIISTFALISAFLLTGTRVDPDFLSKLGGKSFVQSEFLRRLSLYENLNLTHPKLFYADLEFNPKDEKVVLLGKGTVFGDRDLLLASPPLSSPNLFIYKLEIISEGNELIQAGWNSINKKVIETPKGTYNLRLTAPYQPNSKVKLYLANNKLIWTGVIR